MSRDLQALIERGADRYGEGDFSGAAELWREALSLDPADVRARAYVDWIEARLAGQVAIGEGGARSTRDDIMAYALGLDGGAEATGAEKRHGQRLDASTDEEQTDIFLVSERKPWNGPVALAAPHGPPLADARNERLPRREKRTPTGDELSEAMDGLPRGADEAAEGEGDEPMVIELTAALPGETFEGKLEAAKEREEAREGARDARKRGTTEAEPAKPMRRRRITVGDSLREVREAMARGGYQEAYEATERMVAAVGGLDAPELIAHGPLLESVYEVSIGDLRRTVMVAGKPRHTDHRVAFLLSRIDGTLLLEELLDVAGMPRLEALRLLAMLMKEGAIVSYDSRF